MKDYTKKAIATAIFSLFMSNNFVNSMECSIKETPEQVNVKSTVDLVNKFEKLNDASDYFKSAFPENWKNYLELYNKCFKKLSNKKSDYVKNLAEYEKNYNSDARNNSNLAEYEKTLTGNIEYIDKMIKELRKKIDDKFGKSPKIGFFASLFTKPDDQTLLKNYVNKTSDEYRKTKREISQKVGILTKKSINRNIMQAAESSPLKILEQLYNALQQSSGEFTFEKNLLTAPKTLDFKVENSLQKVIDCEWKKLNELKTMLDFYNDLKAKLAGLDKNAENEAGVTSRYFKDLKGKNSTKDILDISTEVKKEIREFKFTVGTNEAIKLYLKVLAYREQLNLLFRECLNKINGLKE